MRVTKKKQRLLSSLELLALFLNFDFKSEDINELKQLFVSSLVFEKSPSRRKTQRLQKRLRADLLPIATSGKIEPEEAYRRIERLVRKINKMNLKLAWAVVPAEYDFAEAMDRNTGRPTGELEFVPIERDDSKWKMRETLAPGQKPLELFGVRWIVSERASLIESRGLEEYLYWSVINAMEQGEFSRLRVCGECGRFFVQADARQKACSEKCRYTANNRKRLECGYFDRRRKLERGKKLVLAQRLLEEGWSVESVADRAGLSETFLKRRWPNLSRRRSTVKPPGKSHN